MDNLKKNLHFHGNHGSLATVKFEINVFLCGPMGTLYVSHRFDIYMKALFNEIKFTAYHLLNL